jgi:hypothetical protein
MDDCFSFGDEVVARLNELHELEQLDALFPEDERDKFLHTKLEIRRAPLRIQIAEGFKQLWAADLADRKAGKGEAANRRLTELLQTRLSRSIAASAPSRWETDDRNGDTGVPPEPSRDARPVEAAEDAVVMPESHVPRHFDPPLPRLTPPQCSSRGITREISPTPAPPPPDQEAKGIAAPESSASGAKPVTARRGRPAGRFDIPHDDAMKEALEIEALHDAECLTFGAIAERKKRGYNTVRRRYRWVKGLRDRGELLGE